MLASMEIEQSNSLVDNMNQLPSIKNSTLLTKLHLLDVSATNIDDFLLQNIPDSVSIQLHMSDIRTNFSRQRLDEIHIGFKIEGDEGSKNGLYGIVKIPVFPDNDERLLVVTGEGSGRFYGVAFSDNESLSDAFSSDSAHNGMYFESNDHHDEKIKNAIEIIERSICQYAKADPDPEFAFAEGKKEHRLLAHGIDFFEMDGYCFTIPESDMKTETATKLNQIVQAPQRTYDHEMSL